MEKHKTKVDGAKVSLLFMSWDELKDEHLNTEKWVDYIDREEYPDWEPTREEWWPELHKAHELVGPVDVIEVSVKVKTSSIHKQAEDDTVSAEMDEIREDTGKWEHIGTVFVPRKINPSLHQCAYFYYATPSWMPSHQVVIDHTPEMEAGRKALGAIIEQHNARPLNVVTDGDGPPIETEGVDRPLPDIETDGPWLKWLRDEEDDDEAA